MKKWWVGVLALVLCLSSCAQTAEEAEPTASAPATPPPTPEITEAPEELPVYSDPITAFYDTLVYDRSYDCTPFWAFLSRQEANAWEAEARHIFTYLKENAHPELERSYLGLDLEQFEENFFAYVVTQSALDADVSWSNLMTGEGEGVYFGTGREAGEALARIGHYRYFVESWYDSFTWLKNETPLDWYVFSPEEALARLTEGNDLEFAQGEYRLEEKEEPEGEELLENPVDGWVSQWLYKDGTTLAMADDTYREAEIWQEELCHVYDVLAVHANPAADLSGRIAAARDALIELAPAHGDAMALELYSNAFSGGDQEGEIRPGSLATSDRWRICVEYYRHETLRLWELILVYIGRDQLTWVFDPKEHEAELPLSRNPELEDWERERLRYLETGRDVYLCFDAERMPFERLRAYTGYDKLSQPLEEVKAYAHRRAPGVQMEVFCQEEYGGPAAVLLMTDEGTTQEFHIGELDVWQGGIGELTAEDVDFDGNSDLLLLLGQSGTGGCLYYAAFLKDSGGGYRYEPGFTSIPKPQIDGEHQVIWGGIDVARGYTYFAYEVEKDIFRLTHKLVTEFADIEGKDVCCTEYTMKNGEESEVGRRAFPADKRLFPEILADYITQDPVWEGWSWCDPWAFFRAG
ncbi:MAG: hypothetical protein HFF06_04960 [Oscillospiraceae bacterium]|jgi:hypothetical protein|nr:hypothetical protein [Oscillospiraceae bacterium]